MGRRPVPIGVLTVLAVLSFATAGSAAFFGSTSNSGSSLSTPCFSRPEVQTGTASSSANGTTTVTISAVDVDSTFLMFSSRHSSNRPVGTVIGGRIASATTVEFIRVTDEASPTTMSLRWYVVDYGCAATVQRGSVTYSTATTDVAITPVASMAQAFVLTSKTTDATAQHFGANDFYTADLTSTTNLRVSQWEAPGASTPHTVYWEVVEFVDPADILVQRGECSIGANTQFYDITVPTAVDRDRTFVLIGGRSPDASPQDVMLSAEFSSATNLEVYRGTGSGPAVECGWQAVSMFDGTYVQLIGEWVTTANPLIPMQAVDVSQTTPMLSGYFGGGLSGGVPFYNADDRVSEGSATVAMTSSTQVSLERGTVIEGTGFSGHVIEWGWSPNSAFDAEAGTLLGGAVVASTFTGFEGSGYVAVIDSVGDGVGGLNFDWPQAGNAHVRIRFAANSGGDRTLSLYVDGAKHSQIVFADTGSWSTRTISSTPITLSAGSHTIELRYDSGDNGLVDIDTVSVEEY